MDSRKKKYIVPVIIGILALIQLIAIIVILVLWDLGFWWKVLLFVVFTIDNFIMFYVVRERVKEIRGGEEDDLSKY